MLYELIIFLAFVFVIYLWFKNREWKIKFEHRVEEFLKSREEFIRRDAIERSARTLSGKTLEKLVPLLENFPYDAHDVRWMGDPIDFVIFDGQSSGSPEKIVFCEVKSGESKLSSSQKRIKELVQEKKVDWKEFRI